MQGREIDSAFRLVKDALAIEAAGAFGIVLELVPAPLAAYISSLLRIPTIGIGAGAGCDGQVQVYHDLFALAGEFLPKHAKQYAQLGDLIRDALRHYAADVQARIFPDASHSFTQKDEVLAELRAQVESELGIKPRKDTPS